jgi:hypothetical protein
LGRYIQRGRRDPLGAPRHIEAVHHHRRSVVDGVPVQLPLFGRSSSLRSFAVAGGIGKNSRCDAFWYLFPFPFILSGIRRRRRNGREISHRRGIALEFMQTVAEMTKGLWRLIATIIHAIVIVAGRRHCTVIVTKMSARQSGHLGSIMV